VFVPPQPKPKPKPVVPPPPPIIQNSVEIKPLRVFIEEISTLGVVKV
jgi:hypothetical protein